MEGSRFKKHKALCPNWNSNEHRASEAVPLSPNAARGAVK